MNAAELPSEEQVLTPAVEQGLRPEFVDQALKQALSDEETQAPDRCGAARQTISRFAGDFKAGTRYRQPVY